MIDIASFKKIGILRSRSRSPKIFVSGVGVGIGIDKRNFSESESESESKNENFLESESESESKSATPLITTGGTCRGFVNFFDFFWQANCFGSFYISSTSF